MTGRTGRTCRLKEEPCILSVRRRLTVNLLSNTSIADEFNVLIWRARQQCAEQMRNRYTTAGAEELVAHDVPLMNVLRKIP